MSANAIHDESGRSSSIVRKGLPPGPSIALYQIARYLRDPYRYYSRMRRRYGDLMTLPTLNGTLVVSFTPEGAGEILAGNGDDFVPGFGVDAIRPIVGAGSLLLLSGDRHKRERKLLSPTFHGARMRAYSPTVREAALRAAAGWSASQPINLREEMEVISLEVILRAVLGAREQTQVDALGRAVRRAVSEVNPLPLFMPFLQRKFFGMGPWARFLERRAELDVLVFDQIARARAGEGQGEDVLTKLLEARYEDGQPLSDTAIRDHLLTLLVAGHETTATALAWAFYECGRDPELTERLRGEIASVGPEPDPDALSALPFLEAFCRETLRLHPIVAEFFRTVKPGHCVEFQGYTIPEGVSLAGSIIDLHRNPDLYPEPEQFRPDRFLDRQFAPNEFAAFGGGHRYCLGAAFALNEMKVVIGTLLPRFDLSLVDSEPVRTVVRNLTLGPSGGVPMRVTPRKSD
jgi:cytochrome P450